LAIRVGFTPIRVVCQNTLSAAHTDEASKLIRIRHTSGLHDAMDNVREVMDMANAEFEATAEQYRQLARHQINSKDLAHYVRRVFELPPSKDEDEGKGKRSRIMDAVTERFESGRGNDMSGVSGTWWAAYNACTEYLSHDRGNTEESRINSLWYGDSATKNAKALQYAYNYVAAAA
jgi:phage/plasmid-like protein (TIGR03299 family)